MKINEKKVRLGRENSYFGLAGLLQSAVWTLISKVITASGAVALSFVVGNETGAEGLGILMIGLSVSLGGATLARFGTDQFIVRTGSIYIKEKKTQNYLGLRRQVFFLTITLSLLVTALGLLFRNNIGGFLFDSPNSELVVIFFLLSVPLYTTIYIQAAWLKAFRQPALAPLLETGSVSFMIAAVLTLRAGFGFENNLEFILILFPVTAGVNVVVGWFFLRYLERKEMLRERNVLQCQIKLFKDLPDFFLISLATYFVGWAPMLVLGYFATDSDVGHFSVAHRAAFLLTFILTAFNSVLAPNISLLHKEGAVVKIESMALTFVLCGLIFATPVILVVIFFPQELLALFGEEFDRAAAALIVMTLGQVVNLATGSVGFLLNMTGNQSVYRSIILSVGFLSLVLLFTLVPIYGVIGAAVAVASTTVVLNLSATYFVYKILGICPVPMLRFLISYIK